MKDAGNRHFPHFFPPPPNTFLLRRPMEGMWSQAPDSEDTRFLGHFACDSAVLSLPRRPHFLAFFLFFPSACVNKMLSYLLSACAHLGAPLLLLILPLMLWPNTFALMRSAQISPQSCFPWKRIVVSIVTL